jgi:hypothetical protein
MKIYERKPEGKPSNTKMGCLLMTNPRKIGMRQEGNLTGNPWHALAGSIVGADTM